MNKQEWANKIYKWINSWPRKVIYPEIHGKKIIVNPGVFPPLFDTPYYAEIVLKYVEKIIQQKGFCRFFEMGAGSGAISILVADMGANVTAVEISDVGIMTIKVNSELHNLDIKIIQSDVWDDVSSGEWDLIFWNFPHNALAPDADINDEKYKASFDLGYQDLKKFIQGSPMRLPNDGIVLLGAGKDICDLELAKKICTPYFNFQISNEMQIPFGNLLWNLLVIELTKKSGGKS